MSPKQPSQPIPDQAGHIARAQKGDKDAYRLLVQGYQDRVFSLALSMVRNREQAEDLTQEIFVKVYFALPRFKGDSAFYTWLFRISTNLCLDHLRKHRPPTVSLDQPMGEDDESTRMTALPAPFSEQPETPLEKEGEVTRLLQALSPDHRIVLTLREAQGYEYEEMADILKCSVNTIKSRLNRAREALKRLYAVKYGNIPIPNYVQNSEEIR